MTTIDAQLKAAFDALKVNRTEVMKKKKKGNLFSNPTTVQMLVQFADNQVLPEKIQTHRVTLPAPMFSLENTDACLITRPPQSKVKDTLRTAAFPHRIERVIDIRKLGRKFKSYAEREKLHKSYTLFLADSIIADKLPELLGRDFMFKAKMPVPVQVPYKPEELKEKLAAGFSTVMFHVAKKSLETTVGIGNTDQEEAALVQNGKAVIEYLKGVPELGNNIRSIRVKTQHSPALLVYQNEKIAPKDAKEAGAGKKRKREETEEKTEKAAPPATKQKGENGKAVTPATQQKEAKAAPAKTAETKKAAPVKTEETPKKATPVKQDEKKAEKDTPKAAPKAAGKAAASPAKGKAASPSTPTPPAAAPATPKAEPVTPKAAATKGKPGKAAPPAAKAAASPRSNSVGSPKPGGKAAWK